MKAQKKPIIIDFYSIDSHEQAYNGLPQFVKSFGDKILEHLMFDEPVASKEDIGIKIKTLEGTSYTVSTQDVVIRGVKGEYYPCKKDIFESTYQVLE